MMIGELAIDTVSIDQLITRHGTQAKLYRTYDRMIELRSLQSNAR
jgi:hypothetical protein